VSLLCCALLCSDTSIPGMSITSIFHVRPLLHWAGVRFRFADFRIFGDFIC
jgi:hypothetical protein